MLPWQQGLLMCHPILFHPTLSHPIYIILSYFTLSPGWKWNFWGGGITSIFLSIENLAFKFSTPTHVQARVSLSYLLMVRQEAIHTSPPPPASLVLRRAGVITCLLPVAVHARWRSLPGEWRICSRDCRADNCSTLAGEGGSTHYQGSCETTQLWRFHAGFFFYWWNFQDAPTLPLISRTPICPLRVARGHDISWFKIKSRECKDHC